MSETPQSQSEPQGAGADPAAPEQSDLRFPLKALAVGIVAMILIALGSAATTWIVGKRIRTIADNQVAVLTGAERLQRQSEVLELSARLAVATGDEAYAERYAEVQPQLRRTLGRLKNAIRLEKNRSTFAAVEAAERRIAQIEYRVLDLAVSDRREAAQALLESPGYSNLVSRYRSGLQSIQQRSRLFVAETRRETNRYLTLNLAMSLIALLLIALAWVILVRPTRSWARELSDAHARAETAARAKSDFLAMMSHEIRTPLNSIIGFADILSTDEQLNARQHRQVDLIRGAGSMLLTVVNDLLDFSKIEAGKIELVPEPFALETLIDNSVSIVRGTAEAKGLEVRVATDPCLSPFFVGDEDRLRQVLLNLLNNAVKFTSRGMVSLAVARDRIETDGRERLRFTVTDTGAGIDPARHDQLFSPFVQADASITRRFGGTGLGLSISRQLVELMGGEIGFISSPGGGSSFWFTVSLERTGRPDLLDDGAGTAAAAEVRGARILLAEDLPMNQELALAMLARGGHRVDLAADGEEAVKMAAATDYDLVLMDIQMPRMDGITAARAIRAMGGDKGAVPIVALTANVLPEQVREFLAAGMDGHVAKPVKQAELHGAIAAVLAGRPRRGETEEAAEAPTEAEGERAFDEPTFEDVKAMLPPERLVAYLDGLEAQVAEVAQGEGEPEALAATAHKIVSQAGMLGLPRLSARARAVEEAIRGGEPVEAPLAAFRAAAGDVAAARARLQGGGTDVP